MVKLPLEAPPATKTLPLGNATLLWKALAVARLPVSQKPSMLNGFEIPVTLPAAAASV